jgi:hypothetical protein
MFKPHRRFWLGLISGKGIFHFPWKFPENLKKIPFRKRFLNSFSFRKRMESEMFFCFLGCAFSLEFIKKPHHFQGFSRVLKKNDFWVACLEKFSFFPHAWQH